MSRLEVAGLLLCFAAVGAGLLAWGLITIWHRRRRPAPRSLTTTVDLGELALTQRGINRIRELQREHRKLIGPPGVVFQVDGDPRDFVPFPLDLDPNDWLAEDPPTWEFPEKWWPPSTLFNQHQPRPWAQQAREGRYGAAYRPKISAPFDVAPLHG